MISAQGLVKRYGKVEALKGVSFELRPGEFTVLLGPNGAGKSTLFQVLSGVFRPDLGAVSVNGVSMSSDAPKALASLGVVFQQMSLDLNMSVERNLWFHAALHGMPKGVAAPAIDLRLRQFGLEESAKRLCRELSGGNRRKVELARALLHTPSSLLADEPTVGLDPASRMSILQEVHRCVQEEKCSVLWATHLVDEAAKAQRVIVLHKGQIIADASPEAVTKQLGGDSLQEAFVKATAPSGKT